MKQYSHNVNMKVIRKSNQRIYLWKQYSAKTKIFWMVHFSLKKTHRLFMHWLLEWSIIR